MNKKRPLFYLVLLLTGMSILGCSDGTDDSFVLPDNVHLSTFGHFNPILADHLLESPLKQPLFWNDSLITLCNIKKIEITRMGNKKPDDVAERFEFLFDLSGRTTSFYFYNFEISNGIYSEIKYKYPHGLLSRLESPVFLGKKASQSMDVRKSDSLILMVKKKNGNDGDSTFIYQSNGIPQVRIEKLGTFISKVQFYLPSNKPLSSLKKVLERSEIDPDDFLLAEKTVTFTENNIPQRSYYLTENFIKGDLTEEWFYGNFGELSAYKKYINNTCVKDMEFTYSKDKILRSFKNNRLLYEVNYH